MLGFPRTVVCRGKLTAATKMWTNRANWRDYGIWVGILEIATHVCILCVKLQESEHMKNRAEIATRLAGRLKDERAAKGLSLDALAKLSGVSRSMLSQIERGESSPTVASLWNLTRALNVDFSTLLDHGAETLSSIREILHADQTPVIRDRAAGCEIRILSASDAVGGTEVYDIRFDTGAALKSTAHKKGCIEHLTVLEGCLEVSSGGEVAAVNAGDTVRYAADVDHAIRSEQPARGVLIVQNA